MFLSSPFIIFTSMSRRKKTYKPGKKNIFLVFFVVLRNSFVKDFKVKLFALFFAIVFWIYTILGNPYTYTFQIPLEIKNVAEGKTLKESVPEKIEVEFTGRGSDLVFLFLSPASGLRLDLDLRTIRYFYNFNLMDYYQKHRENLVYPRNLDIAFNKIVSPDSVVIELDNEDSKTVPIKPMVFIDTEPGYIKSYPLEIQPKEIAITGPQFYLKQIDEVVTDSLVRDNVNLTMDSDLKLVMPENSTVNYAAKKVRIRQVVEQIGEKIIKDIPVQVINDDDAVKIEIIPDKISLKVSGALSHLTRLKEDDFNISFDYKKSWQSGESYYTPTIEKPEQVVDVIDVIPKRLNVRVIRERISK